MSFILTISSDDARARSTDDLASPMHAVGSVSIPSLDSEPLTVDGGAFQLFAPDDPDPEIRHMWYRLPLLARDGRRLFFEGFKVVRPGTMIARLAGDDHAVRDRPRGRTRRRRSSGAGSCGSRPLGLREADALHDGDRRGRGAGAAADPGALPGGVRRAAPPRVRHGDPAPVADEGARPTAAPPTAAGPAARGDPVPVGRRRRPAPHPIRGRHAGTGRDLARVRAPTRSRSRRTRSTRTPSSTSSSTASTSGSRNGAARRSCRPATASSTPTMSPASTTPRRRPRSSRRPGAVTCTGSPTASAR